MRRRRIGPAPATSTPSTRRSVMLPSSGCSASDRLQRAGRSDRVERSDDWIAAERRRHRIQGGEVLVQEHCRRRAIAPASACTSAARSARVLSADQDYDGPSSTSSAPAAGEHLTKDRLRAKEFQGVGNLSAEAAGRKRPPAANPLARSTQLSQRPHGRARRGRIVAAVRQAVVEAECDAAPDDLGLASS